MVEAKIGETDRASRPGSCSNRWRSLFSRGGLEEDYVRHGKREVGYHADPVEKAMGASFSSRSSWRGSWCLGSTFQIHVVIISYARGDIPFGGNS